MPRPKVHGVCHKCSITSCPDSSSDCPESGEPASSATETYVDPTGLLDDMFNCQVSADTDVQTAAGSSDKELLASATTAQSDESPSDDDTINDDADVTDNSTPVVTFAKALHSLDNLCAYLESAGI